MYVIPWDGLPLRRDTRCSMIRSWRPLAAVAAVGAVSLQPTPTLDGIVPGNTNLPCQKNTSQPGKYVYGCVEKTYREEKFRLASLS